MPCCGWGRTRRTSSAASCARRAATRPGARGSGSSSRPTSPTARSCGCRPALGRHEHRARPPRDLRLQGGGRGRVRRVPRPVGTRHRLGRPRRGGVPGPLGDRRGAFFRADDVVLTPGGSEFTWAEQRVRLSVPGAHNVANAAAALTACVMMGLPRETLAGTLEDFLAPGAGSRCWAAPRRARPWSTTTRTIRRRWRRRSPPRGRAGPAGSSPSSSRTCTRARSSSPASSARRSRPPTSSASSGSTPRARRPPTSPA